MLTKAPLLTPDEQDEVVNLLLRMGFASTAAGRAYLTQDLPALARHPDVVESQDTAAAHCRAIIRVALKMTRPAADPRPAPIYTVLDNARQNGTGDRKDVRLGELLDLIEQRG